jgi:hypothetical protein
MVAANTEVKSVLRGAHREIHEHNNRLVIEQELDSAGPDILCGCHKLAEVWDRKTELVEEVMLSVLTRGASMWERSASK